MPTRLKQAQQRIAIARLVIDMMRDMSSVYMHDEKFSVISDETLLALAVLLGQLEGRPMTAAKLAQYVGMPRPTAVRKLRAMAERGLVEAASRGRFIIPAKPANTPEVIALIERLKKLIHKTSADLSKLDG